MVREPALQESLPEALSGAAPTASDLSPLRRAAAWRAPEIVFWLIPLVAYFLFPKSLALLSQIAITALFALSIDLILGYAGIVSLGHAAFFGLGAYAAGMLSKYGYGDPFLGLAFGALVAAVVGFITSFLVLRGTDLARLMVTMGVAMMLYEAANKATAFTGGVDGLQGVEMGKVLGLFGFDLYSKTAYWYSVAVLFVLFWVARRVVNSPFGMSLRGIKQNVARMPAIGAPVHGRLVAVYTLGAAYAGVAGALLTQTTQFVSLDVLAFTRSAEIMLMLVLGGTGCLYGALIGTTVFMVAHHFLSGINPQYWQFWLGLVLVLIVLFARDGIMGVVQRVQERLARRTAA